MSSEKESFDERHEINKKNPAVDVRKFQEEQEKLIQAGAHLQIARWHGHLFGAYLDVGFSKAEALELIKAYISKE